MLLRVSFGSRAASRGKSHSWLTPERKRPRPSAKTISVALGSSEQIRTVTRLSEGVSRLEFAMRQPVIGAEHHRIPRQITQQRIPIEGQACRVAFRQPRET